MTFGSNLPSHLNWKRRMKAKYWACCFIIAVSTTSLSAFADTPNWKASIPVPDLERLITADAKLIHDTISGGLDDKKVQSKAKITAVMVAGYAQTAMLVDKSKAEQFAAIRDHALKLSQAIASGKVQEAKSLVAELSPTMKHDESTKPEPIDLAHLTDLDTLMSQFKPELGSGGGRGLEKKLKGLIGKRSTLLSEELKEATQLGYQSAVIAQFAEAMGPEKDQGKKKKADWTKWSRDMSENGTALGKAASAARPDDRAVKAALRKLDESCIKCHAVFRD